MTNLKLTILAPERRLCEGADVSEVTVQGSEGQIQILPGHAPTIGTLETGLFSFRSPDGASTSGAISTGFFEVVADQIVVTAETIELAGEIDVARAKKAQQEAEQVLKDANIDEQKFKKYQLKLERALIRQQAAK